ncbi:MAG TPA: serpin family protein [Herpetosiphonaceae bacterium]
MDIHPAIIPGHLALSFDLFRAACAGDLERNVVISPLSVQLALAVLLEGAAGETAAAIRVALGIDHLPPEEAGAAVAALRQALLAPADKIEIALASSFWAARNFSLRPQFVARARALFDATVSTVDFGNPAAIAQINDWVSSNTRGKIPQIVDTPDDGIVAMLLDAVYFNGRWQHSFDAKKTELRRFIVFRNGEIDAKEIPTMEHDAAYARLAERGETFGFEMADLPYGDGALSMIIMLPWRRFRPALFDHLTAAAWTEWMERLEPGPTLKLWLPIFQVDQHHDLKPILAALGMGALFDPVAADFSALSAARPGPCVTGANQRVVIEVAEKGTVAAAVTKMEMKLTGLGPPSVIVNQPFFFAIRDNRSGALLFMGWIADPEQTGEDRAANAEQRG